MRINVNVVNIGFENTDKILSAISFLNKNQGTYEFKLFEDDRYIKYKPMGGFQITTKEIYELMERVANDEPKGPILTIGVVENYLVGNELSNLFGSMQTDDNNNLTGKAATSTFGLGRLDDDLQINVYLIFQFISFAIRFIVGTGMIHNRPEDRGCLFHSKINKLDILEAINTGYISRKSKKIINEHLELDQIIEFQTMLSIVSEAAQTNNPDDILEKYVKENEDESENQRSVFISYSHKDTKWLERLRVHLIPFERRNLIDVWVDTEIQPGELWFDEIQSALSFAKVAVLLVSANFLASEFIFEKELPPLLASAVNGGTKILPIIVSPCAFGESELSVFQSINYPTMPLSGLDEHQQEEMLVKATKRIVNAIEAK